MHGNMAPPLPEPAEAPAVIRFFPSPKAASLLILANLALACGTAPPPKSETPEISPPEPPAMSEAQRLAEQARHAWGKRSDPAARAEARRSWGRLGELDADTVEPYLRLAEAHLFELSPALSAQPEAVRRALHSAEQAAATALERAQPDLHFELQALRARQPGAIGAQGARAIYWLAQARLGRARQDGYAALLSQRATVLEALRLAAELAPEVHHAGPDRTLGALLAQPLAFENRDLEGARTHFERALRRAPNYVANHVEYAKRYAVAAQDSQAFRESLVAALESRSPASLQAENLHAQAEARALRDLAGELFE